MFENIAAIYFGYIFLAWVNTDDVLDVASLEYNVYVAL